MVKNISLFLNFMTDVNFKNKVKASVWWLAQGYSVGVVAVESTKNKYKCYIGVAGKYNKKMDEIIIARNGARVEPDIAKAIFPKFNFTI